MNGQSLNEPETFLREFALIPDLRVSVMGVIRTVHQRCPLEALCDLKFPDEPPVPGPSTAARKLGINPEFRAVVVNTADNNPLRNLALRHDMLCIIADQA